jgi:MFS family permease
LHQVHERLSGNFSSLKHTNFRIFWFGQLISLIGSWMQTISLPWLTYNITKSAFLVGLIGALQFLPSLAFSLFAGVIIDKYNKKNLLLITQSTLAILAFLLFFLVFGNMIKFWHIVIITFFIGCANSLDMPARQSFMIELVGKDDLMNAIALNSSIFNLARIFGPAVAGLLMSAIGISFCFFINAVSFLPIIIGLIFFIKPVFKYHNQKNDIKIIKNIKEGLLYIKKEKLILTTLISVLIMGTFAMNFNVMVPVFSKEILNLQEAQFGFLMSSMGIGSLIGALIIASRSKKGPNEFFLTGCTIIVTLLLLLLGISDTYVLTALILGLTGIFTVMFFTTANSLLQLKSKDEFRGRVISVYTLFFAGTTPIGNLFSGGISQKFGVRCSFIVCAVVIIFSITFFHFIKKIIKEKADIPSNSKTSDFEEAKTDIPRIDE